MTNKIGIRKWFTEIGQTLNEDHFSEAIQHQTRVFNADEIGFNICPKPGSVFAEKWCKNMYQIEKGPAKKNMTVLCTFSAAGTFCTPWLYTLIKGYLPE